MKQKKTGKAIIAVLIVVIAVLEWMPRGRGGEIRPMRFGTEVTASLRSASDTVSYRVTVESPGTLECHMRYPSQSLFGSTGWRLVVYRMMSVDGSGSASAPYEITRTETERTGTEVTTESIGVYAGEYRLTLSVAGTYSADEVGIECNFTQNTSFEAEPNDTPSRYNEVISGVPVQGTASRHAGTTDTDRDCYLLRLSEPSAVSVTLSHEAVEQTSVAWTVQLQDIHGNEITTVQSRFADSITTTDTVGLGAGNYIICVTSRIRSGLVYTLTPSAKKVTSYEKESNDTADTANAITAGAPITGTLAARSQASDKDYYTFRLQSDAVAQVLFSHAVTGDKDQQAWRVRIMDENGNALCQSVSGLQTAVTAVPEIGLAAGRYYVVVDSDNLYHNGSEYAVILSLRETTGYEAEMNDTKETANTIENGESITGRLQSTQDTDCYTMTVKSYSMVQVSFRKEADTNTNGEYKIRVYDKDGKQLPLFDREGWPITEKNGSQRYTQTVTGTESKTEVYVQTEPGTVTVKVESDLYYTGKEYTLTLTEGLLH